MPVNPLDHTKLMNEHLRQNPFWANFIRAMDDVINPCIKGAVENLSHIRNPDVEPIFAFLNTRMLGFKVSTLAIDDNEYPKLLRNLGKFWQTRGASKVFINFLSYIKNVELIYQDLWADSTWFPAGYFDPANINASNLDMTVDQLSNDYPVNGELWNGGTWFPTSYFDIVYSRLDFPNLDEQLFTELIYQLAPEHLVMRYLVGIESSITNVYINAIPLSTAEYSTSIISDGYGYTANTSTLPTVDTSIIRFSDNTPATFSDLTVAKFSS